MRYRNENGQLTVSLAELAELTKTEGAAYYQVGEKYYFECDEKEYECTGSCDETDMLMRFISADGVGLGIPKVALGTFLPDVASEGMALVRKEG